MREGWIRVYEGDVWRSRVVQAHLESEGVPAVVADPQRHEPGPETGGMTQAPSSVWVESVREGDARAILARPRGEGTKLSEGFGPIDPVPERSFVREPDDSRFGDGDGGGDVDGD